jgi:MYXO-CTERM domain-containing protein
MTTRSIRLRITGLAAGGALALALLGGGSTALAADTTVDISGFAFAPQTATVTVGDTVTWANADAQGHTATADDGSFDTGTIAGNTSKAVTLTTAGTFAYHCRIHPAMTATLIVEAAAASSPGATVPPTDTLAEASVDASAAGSGPAGALLLGLAGLVGLAIWRRRFGEQPADR